MKMVVIQSLRVGNAIFYGNRSGMRMVNIYLRVIIAQRGATESRTCAGARTYIFPTSGKV